MAYWVKGVKYIYLHVYIYDYNELVSVKLQWYFGFLTDIKIQTQPF